MDRKHEPSRRRAKRPVVITETGKVCTECGQDKSLDQFSSYRLGTLGLMAACRPCDNERSSRVNRARTAAERRDIWLRRTYGITHEHYVEMLRTQGGACAVCGSRDNQDPRFEWFHIDHDHHTGRVRGLLCGPCNKGLGHFEDSPDRLVAAAAYLLQNVDVLEEGVRGPQTALPR